jgi:hypothetical protein
MSLVSKQGLESKPSKSGNIEFSKIPGYHSEHSDIGNVYFQSLHIYIAQIQKER